MKNKKQNMKKEELERKVVIVKQAIAELRKNPDLMKKMEKVLVC
jgi:pantoate kinase